jgi:hypothetical protein
MNVACAYSVGMENILGQITGPYVSRALKTLPKAETMPDGAIMEATIEVPGLGTVRFTARRMRHKRGKSTHYFWTAESASVIT